VRKGELEGPLSEILDAGIQIAGADMGNIQLRNADTGHLEIVVQRGFDSAFLEFFAAVRDHEAACGRAMSTGQRVIIADVAEDPLFVGTDALTVLLRAGVRAVQSTPIRSPAGALLGVLSTHYRTPRRPEARDLHLLDMLSHVAAGYIERARAERDIAETQGRLELADRAKDEFLAMLGHELRNPLGAVAGAVGVLNLSSLPPDAERARTVVERQVQHLSRLVDDLLDVSRVTTGKIVLARQHLDLGALVEAIVSQWRAAGRFGQHRLSLEVVPAWIDADRTRIEQILDNLIANALRYTPSGGGIDVRVRTNDQEAILEVQDTGAGISPVMLDRIFDLFVQGHRGPDRGKGGLGIGLTLVKTLTMLHGGTVVAHSDGDGRGSVFTVRLPRVRE
jgi:signal transduction histidine kinase